MKTKNLPDFCQLLAASLKLLVPQVRGFTDMFQKPQDRGEFGKVQWLFCQSLEQGEPPFLGLWGRHGEGLEVLPSAEMTPGCLTGRGTGAHHTILVI